MTKSRDHRLYPPQFHQLAVQAASPANFPITLTLPDKRTAFQLRASFYAFRTALRLDPSMHTLSVQADQLSITRPNDLTLTFDHQANSPALQALSRALSTHQPDPNNIIPPPLDLVQADPQPTHPPTELPDHVRARMIELGMLPST